MSRENESDGRRNYSYGDEEDETKVEERKQKKDEWKEQQRPKQIGSRMDE